MSTRKYFNSGEMSIAQLRRLINAQLANGNEAVLIFGENQPPKKVWKRISALIGDVEIDIEVRHLQLREYLRSAITGASVGAVIGMAAPILAALAKNHPIGRAVMISSTIVGAIFGWLVGGALSHIGECKVYKWNGETRVIFVSATES